MIARSALPAIILLASAGPAHADERRYMLTDFDAVRIEGPYEVRVNTGGTPGAVATGSGR
ncbi:MAG: DUF2807 domain-containing protein, partial [Sphingomonadales bacterium]|nr:DUF2807 domain-containing protein [Sphingomonadales bacterium]